MKTDVDNPTESMRAGWTLEYQVTFSRGVNGRTRLRVGPVPIGPTPPRVPRIAHLLALAHHFDALLRSDVIMNYADLARLAGVSRSRITQIMNLLHLAPDIQEAILDLPSARESRSPLSEGDLRPLTAIPEWSMQRLLWKRLGSIS